MATGLGTGYDPLLSYGARSPRGVEYWKTVGQQQTIFGGRAARQSPARALPKSLMLQGCLFGMDGGFHD